MEVARGHEAAFWRWLVADPQQGGLPAVLLVLTGVTGVVDAVRILSLGRVFVANMTGYIVFIGFALAGAPGFLAAASLFALAGFLLGALAAGMVIRRIEERRPLLVGVNNPNTQPAAS
ncbi:MAG: YoaK family protein [Candidatus Limnocylindrales bacterium]